jgi:hypothetical protein
VEAAARTLHHLLVQSRQLTLSGVALKDDSDSAQLPGSLIAAKADQTT